MSGAPSPDVMSDTLERLAAAVLRDAATTIEKVKDLAVLAGWSAEEALSKSVEILRASAASREDKIQ